MKKIGILGGSFNPPHKAHLEMAKAAMEQYKLDEVWLMPNHHPPHKSENSFVRDDHRVRMVKQLLAGKDTERLKFCGIELERDGMSYTYETLEYLKKQYPDDRFYFIIGADSARDLPTWRNPKRICELATILVAPRSDIYGKKFMKMLYEREEQLNGKFFAIKIKDKYADYSSSTIRKNLKSDKDKVRNKAEKMLTNRVKRYISLHGLYGVNKRKYNCYDINYITRDDHNKNNTTKNTDIEIKKEKKKYIDDIKKALRCTLDKKRYKHTLGVADTAKKLSKIYEKRLNKSQAKEYINLPDKAYLAGLLHDCAKYYTHIEQLALSDRYRIELTPTERSNPQLIHGKLGSYIAKKRYGVKDKQILEAIRVHTVGKPDMSILEQIIYISDYIEPGRKIPDAKHPLDSLRKLAKKDLDLTTYYILENTLGYLGTSGKPIDETSLETLEFYKRNER